jgi:hypothetical protein
VTASATANATGGSAPYTYSWTQLSGSSFAVTGTNAATITLTGYVVADWCRHGHRNARRRAPITLTGYVVADWCYPEPASGTFRVTVTGANGLSSTKDLTVSFSGSPGGVPPPQCEAPFRTSKPSTK